MNKNISIYILTKRLYNLLCLPIVFISKYDKNELVKLNKFTGLIGKDDIVELLSRIPINRLTVYNVKDLLLYTHQSVDLTTGKIHISWGPGNHSSIDENIMEHYNKHVLSDEGVYWNNILNHMSCESYRDYAVESFYKMKRVIIHSNGKNTYMSGFRENIFVVGRYHEGIFGISSCYYVEGGEKMGRYNDMCFKIEVDE